jgi:hypothetical protein
VLSSVCLTILIVDVGASSIELLSTILTKKFSKKYSVGAAGAASAWNEYCPATPNAAL